VEQSGGGGGNGPWHVSDFLTFDSDSFNVVRHPSAFPEHLFIALKLLEIILHEFTMNLNMLSLS
jgi:hypothetical protein